MPSTPHDDEPAEGTYSLADLEAMEAAGDIELAMPGTPEAAVARRAMVGQLAEYDADLVAREGPDALTSDRQLRQAALEAEARPGTIGHALARYREARGWTRDQLADWFGVTPTGLAAIAIEQRPRATSGLGPGEIPATVLPLAGTLPTIAARYGVDPARLSAALVGHGGVEATSEGDGP